MAAVQPTRITDAQLAEGLAKQLEWLRKNDEITPNAPTLCGEDSGVPGKSPDPTRVSPIVSLPTLPASLFVMHHP